MSDLHLIDIPIDLNCLHRWGQGRGLVHRGYLDEGLALHHLLGECFGRAILQPFRLMVAREGRQGNVYGYSAQNGVALSQIAYAVATPALLDVITPEKMKSIPRPVSTWHMGQKLGFDLRLRPVVRLVQPLEYKGKRFRVGAEVDAWLSHVLTGGKSDREALYLAWLEARLGEAATLDRQSSRMARFRRSKAVRGGRIAEGPEVVIHGTLVVRDPSVFATKLTSGIGRHKSYGYGMLLLRPPQRIC